MTANQPMVLTYQNNMVRSILDQSYIKSLDGRENCDAIIITSMFMWELFNNINTPIEKILIQKLGLISDRIVIANKSTLCEATELDTGVISSFDKIINHQNTQVIRQWLHDENPSISDFRNALSPGLTSETFKRLFNEYAQVTWIPKLQVGFGRFDCAKDRQLTRESFKAENEETSEYLCNKSIEACYEILISKGFLHEQAVLFLKEPSVLYNRVFCYSAIHMYRSTQGSKGQINSEIVANDIKDADYLFLAHHAESLMSDDTAMKLVFSHLKKSHKMLSKIEASL